NAVGRAQKPPVNFLGAHSPVEDFAFSIGVPRVKGDIKVVACSDGGRLYFADGDGTARRDQTKKCTYEVRRMIHDRAISHVLLSKPPVIYLLGKPLFLPIALHRLLWGVVQRHSRENAKERIAPPGRFRQTRWQCNPHRNHPTTMGYMARA